MGNCKARFWFDEETNYVFKAQLQHNHEAAKYIIKNGIYIKL